MYDLLTEYSIIVLTDELEKAVSCFDILSEGFNCEIF